jgi:hypothetical protein
MLLACLLFIPACPTLKLGAISVRSGSVGATSLILDLSVLVEETDPVGTPDGGEPQSGRGMVALELPIGWTVTRATMSSPLEQTPRALIPAPQAAVAFGEAFPETGGAFWALASSTQTIPQGSHAYPVEIEVSFPKRSKGGKIGIAAAIFQDQMTDLPAPQEFELAIRGRNATLAPRQRLDGSLPDAMPDAPSDKAPSGE